MNCAACDSANVAMRYDVDKFQYLDQGKLVTLSAGVKVYSCGNCGLEYTDHEAEEARDQAVKWYLNEKVRS